MAETEVRETDTVDDWGAGDEPMTASQRIYLDTLASHAGEPTPSETMTKIEATRLIQHLEHEAEIAESDSREIDTEDDPDIDPVRAQS